VLHAILSRDYKFHHNLLLIASFLEEEFLINAAGSDI
jgi:hypothetical protein